MMQIAAALAYLKASNDPLTLARLGAMLEGAPPPDDLLAALAAQQNADGGWPLGGRAGAPSSVDDSAQMLVTLSELDELGGELAEGTAAFLASCQSPRGWFREPAALRGANPPMWADPDDDATLAYTTARAAGALAIAETDPVAVDNAVNWLQGQVSPQGLLPGWRILATCWALPAFVALGHRDTRTVKRMVGGLGNALSKEWDAPLLATMLYTLGQAGFPRVTQVIKRGLELAGALQLPSGAWPDEEGQPSLETTYQFVRAARRFGLR